jgi:hypothetical protein
MYPITFGPRIDKERSSPFLPDDPEQLITLGQFNPVPFIIGLNENEGGLFGASKQNDKKFSIKSDDILCNQYFVIL